tara:strand:+ start:5553 stop:6887 length:1335 start_codon:yes stop_codon:yes gene_type:complete
MRKKEAIIYISKSVANNWQIPSTSDNRGVNAVYSDNVFAIIFHLIVRLNLSQQAALQQLERRKLIEVQVCSQATRSKRISGIKKDNGEGFKNLVINDEGYSFHRVVPHETESYDIYKFQGDSKAAVKPKKFSKFNNPKKISKLNIPKESKESKELCTVNKAIKDWLSANENEVHILKSFLALDDVSTFNILIPYFPNRAIKRGREEIDIFEKLESIKNKHELMPDILKENKDNNNQHPVPSDEIKAILVHFPYQNKEVGSDAKLNYLTAFWLTCHKTRLNYLLYFKEKKKLDADNRYSILLKRTNKSLIVNITQTKGTGRRAVPTRLKATIKLPTLTPKAPFLSIDELEVNSKGYVIDIDVSDCGLTFPFEEYVGGIATGNAAQRLGEWFNWINRYTNLEDKLYSYYHQLSPSEVTKYNAMPEFKQNPFTVFKRNPFVLPLSLK